MRTFRVQGVSLVGVEALLVKVEARFERADRQRTELVLSGLPDLVIRESRGRLLSALQANGLRLPQGRLFLNLAPAGMRKGGETLDLPLALVAAAAVGHITGRRLGQALFLGELGIDGTLHPVPGGLAAGLAARRAGIPRLIAPSENAREAAMIEGLETRGASDLRQVVRWLTTGEGLAAVRRQELDTATPAVQTRGASTVPLDRIRGQELAKRALAVAAAGGHGMLFMGPPGTGKSLLARALAPLLPPLTLDERIEITCIRSLRERREPGLVSTRPFRAPHHTATSAGLIGGGTPPGPGEVTLAHGGVLFLDELPEFRREVLEALRLPLETGRVLLARAGRRVELPASFQLVCAMNPCPCGFRGHPGVTCTCTPHDIRRYRKRISGPLLDRIDLRLEIGPPSVAQLESRAPPELSFAAVTAAIGRARDRAHERQGTRRNGALEPDELDRHAPLDAEGRRILERAASRHGLSARGVQSVRRVARTLADLEGEAQAAHRHVAEALALRGELP